MRYELEMLVLRDSARQALQCLTCLRCLRYSSCLRCLKCLRCFSGLRCGISSRPKVSYQIQDTPEINRLSSLFLGTLFFAPFSRKSIRPIRQLGGFGKFGRAFCFRFVSIEESQQQARSDFTIRNRLNVHGQRESLLNA
jgi:hypothetical protein